MTHTPDPLHFCVTCGQPIGSEAVAAEMLAALKACVAEHDTRHRTIIGDVSVFTGSTWDAARAAIAKAEAG